MRVAACGPSFHHPRVDYLEAVRHAALGLPGAWEDHPWGEDPVFKNARGKIFVFCGLGRGTGFTATVKLPPAESEEALTLPFVSVARYVGRYGWVTVAVANPFELEVLLGWVLTSYATVGGEKRRGR